MIYEINWICRSQQGCWVSSATFCTLSEPIIARVYVKVTLVRHIYCSQAYQVRSEHTGQSHVYQSHHCQQPCLRPYQWPFQSCTYQSHNCQSHTGQSLLNSARSPVSQPELSDIQLKSNYLQQVQIAITCWTFVRRLLLSHPTSFLG